MRDIESLRLNQTQKLRFEKALEQLDFLSAAANSNACVTVGDTILVDHQDGLLKGHGTTDFDGELVATVCGVVERVNKLVYVRTLRARYKPQIGDIIVGRVIEVAPKRWRLEINFTQDAVLMLSSITIDNGIQRRQTADDELNMRSIFVENDVVCAEVGGVQHDGSLHLQARSKKYGKLERGQLLTVPPYLVKRRKQHYHYLEQLGIDLILGCNGFIWIGEHIDTKDDMLEDQVAKSEQQNEEPGDNFSKETYTSVEIRQNICRAANAVRVLCALGFNITADVIIETVKLSNSVDIHEMLGPEFYVLVAESEVERRRSSKKK